jgi:acetolactate synthase I/II/III large subunit
MCQEYRLPIFIIIVNNGGYIAMKLGHERMYPDGVAVKQNTYLGVNITPSPDYCKIAEAFGAYGERVERPEDIERALRRGLEQIAGGRAALLDIKVGPP